MLPNSCTVCGKPIVLIPSASERAKRFGDTPQHYKSLFTTHAACAVRQRSLASIKLMQKIVNESEG